MLFKICGNFVFFPLISTYRQSMRNNPFQNIYDRAWKFTESLSPIALAAKIRPLLIISACQEAN